MTSPRSSFDLVRVTAVRHVRDHVLWLEFSDGVAGELNLVDRLVGDTRDVPEISRFFGIVISMFYSDHARPHFLARCGDSISLEIDGDGIRGSFPPNRLPLLFEWRKLYRAELRADWNDCAAENRRCRSSRSSN